MSPDALWLPDWPAPASVRACVTTRIGGHSRAPYESLNLGDHVADNPEHVQKNRQDLLEALKPLGVSQGIQWLNQVHGTQVVHAPTSSVRPSADAATTTVSGLALAILTADCLPVLLCNASGTQVAAAHAGWRGLCDGVLEATVATFAPDEPVMAWLGPAIGSSAFEVGPEVRAAFVAQAPEDGVAFRPSPRHPDRWMASLVTLARHRLARAGVTAVYGEENCTFSQPNLFYSYRRQAQTGRQATCIWRVAE